MAIGCLVSLTVVTSTTAFHAALAGCTCCGRTSTSRLIDLSVDAGGRPPRPNGRGAPNPVFGGGGGAGTTPGLPPAPAVALLSRAFTTTRAEPLLIFGAVATSVVTPVRGKFTSVCAEDWPT